MYYSGEKNVNIEVDKSILFHAMQSGQRIFEVDQEGKSQFTMIKDLQFHPVTDEVIHIDLMRVRRSEKMTIIVPLILTGEAIGVKEGGLLSQSINQLEISCFPTDVPEQIELNIEDMELNSAMSVLDIKLQKDIEILTEKEVNVVTISQLVEDEPDEEDELSEAASASSEENDKPDEESSESGTK